MTVANLKVMKVDKENGIVVVHGAVPGPKNCVVKLQDAIKKPWPEATWPLTVEGATEVLSEVTEKVPAAA
jgi:large subunit ribosomal protein L3